MGIYEKLVDHDDKFSKVSTPPIIVNEFNLSSPSDLERFNDAIYTTYKDDNLEILPHCDCGKVKGEHNVGIYCENCNTQCLPVTERPLESGLWIRAPEGVDALINPMVWNILANKLTDQKISILEWLTNPTMQVPANHGSNAIHKLIEAGYQRGLNNFIRNFDGLMEFLIMGKIIKNFKVPERAEFISFLQMNRDAIFSKHLPVPSKLAMITEKTPMMTYADPTMNLAVDAIRTITSIENSMIPLSHRKTESRTVKAIQQLSEFYANFSKSSLSPKPGWLRKHTYGSRSHFSARAVISSISDPHDYDEIHLPWSMSVMVFKLHLISKLLRRGFTPNQAIQYIYEHALKYSPLLDEIFQELIAEAPGKGLSVILNRNPSLTRGSIQYLYATYIDPNPKAKTIRLSVLILGAYNKSLLLLAETLVE